MLETELAEAEGATEAEAMTVMQIQDPVYMQGLTLTNSYKLQSLLHGGNVSAIFSIISDKKKRPILQLPSYRGNEEKSRL